MSILVEHGYLPYGPAAGCSVIRLTTDISKAIDANSFITDLYAILQEKLLMNAFVSTIDGSNRLSYVQIKDIDGKNLSDYVENVDAIINAISLESLHKQQQTEYQQQFFADYKVYDVSKFHPVQFIYWGEPFKNPTRELNDFIGEFAVVYLECDIDASKCNEQAFAMAFDFTRPVGNTTVAFFKPKSLDDFTQISESYDAYVDMSNDIMKARIWIDAPTAELEDKAFAFGYKPFKHLTSKQTLKYD